MLRWENDKLRPSVRNAATLQSGVASLFPDEISAKQP
jgi:hypothetical protein